MICKKCGTEIDDDSLFCESCGAKNCKEEKNRKNLKMTRKKALTIIGISLLIIALFIGYFIYVPIYFGDNYYGHADVVIENMSYDGKQFIDRIEIDKENKTAKLILSNNNFDSIIDNSLVVNNYRFSSQENYLAYDYNTEKYCFENVNNVLLSIKSLDENIDHYSKYIVYNYDNEFEDNKIYCFTLGFELEPNENYGNPIRQLLLKTIKNPYISTYIYRRQFVDYESFSADSYFVYESGAFKPLFLDENPDNYVNAVWNGSNLNVIKWDENGEGHLEGPVKTRENIKIN